MKIDVEQGNVFEQFDYDPGIETLAMSDILRKLYTDEDMVLTDRGRINWIRKAADRLEEYHKFVTENK